MSSANRRLLASLAVCLCGLTLLPLRAQNNAGPSVQLIPAPRLELAPRIDSNIPMMWDLVDGEPRLFALASFAGIPALMAGADLEGLSQTGDVAFVPHPGHGVWIESVVGDEAGVWYGYYHHEVPADACGRPDRAIVGIGAAKSLDQGRTWMDLGIILEAPADSYACRSTNRYVLGGNGDLSAMLHPDQQDLFLYFSQYSRDPAAQGVAVARLAWADRDAPAGRATIWQNGVWLPARRVAPPDGSVPDESAAARWEYPAGTPLVRVTEPWHDGHKEADAFWGPSIHWNTYLERYVMLLNHARDEEFHNEGIYVSYANGLDDPRGWTRPRKIMDGGGWYPQVAGLEPSSGTDKRAGQRARFFLTGKSERLIEFRR